ncbi:hypothetical protein D3C87_1948740 [compost metagenome]
MAGAWVAAGSVAVAGAAGATAMGAVSARWSTPGRPRRAPISTPIRNNSAHSSTAQVTAIVTMRELIENT